MINEGYKADLTLYDLSGEIKLGCVCVRRGATSTGTTSIANIVTRTLVVHFSKFYGFAETQMRVHV